MRPMEKTRLSGLWVGCLDGGAVHKAGTRGGAIGVEAGHPRSSAVAVVKGKHNIEHGV